MNRRVSEEERVGRLPEVLVRVVPHTFPSPVQNAVEHCIENTTATSCCDYKQKVSAEAVLSLSNGHLRHHLNSDPGH